MAGEIASAFIAILPSMKGFGSQLVDQMGPQVRAASTKVGAQSGTALGSALGGSASKAALPGINSINSAITGAKTNSESWLATDAQMAIKNVFLYGGMYKAIQGISAGTEAMFDAMVGFNSQLQQAQIGFTQILGSSTAASSELSWVKDFAKATPFNFKDVLQYDQQLQAMIGNSKEAHDALTAAGDAAAGLGRGADGVRSISLALGQMATKGKIQSQELVLQLSQVGINGVKILADQLGTTTADIQAKMQKGVLDSATYLPVLIAGIEKQYAGLMVKDSATLGGMWSNIQDTLQQGLAAAGKPLFDELTSEAKSALAALSSPEVQKGFDAFGQTAATGAKGLAELAKWAWNGKDAFIALGAVMASQAIWNSTKVQGFVGTLKTIPAAMTGVQTAARSVAAAEDALTAAQVATAQSGVEIVDATKADTAARVQHSQALRADLVATEALAAAQDASYNFSPLAGTAGLSATTAARQKTLNLEIANAKRVSAEASGQLTLAESETAVASARLVAAQEAEIASDAGLVTANGELTASEIAYGDAVNVRAGAMSKLKGIGSSLGPLVGIAAAADGLNRVTGAANDTGKAVAGVAEATGGAALAGAAFGLALGPEGAAAGAAIGGVVGLTTALINLQAAQDAANKDTSGTADALTKIGVSSDTAAKFLSNLTNAQLKALGGSQAVVDAVQDGGAKYDELVSKLKAAQKAQEALAAADRAAASNPAFTRGANGLSQKAAEEEATAKALAAALRDLGPAGAEAAYAQFDAQEAADAATGSYGALSKAAYEAAIAAGAITPAMEQTGVAAEGASGMVGYLISALTGLPVNTPINFSTNATDILAKIYALQAQIATISSSSTTATVDRNYELQAQYAAQLKKALTTPSALARVAAPSIPRIGSGSGSRAAAANAAASAAKQAAEAAAQKLKTDRQAQLSFADAFGTLMQSALEGDFDQYRDKLADEIKTLTQDGYSKAASTLKRLSGTLTQASLDYSALTNKIKAATDAETSLTGKMQDQYQSTVDLIEGLGKVTDAQSFDQLAYLLGQTTDAATQYQQILKSLKTEGLSEDLWNQLAQAGPQSLGLAQSILSQGQAGVDQLNSLSGSLVDAADSMGGLVSDSMYKQGVDAMQAYIDGLDSQSAALEAQLTTIANNILKQAAGAITPGNAGYSPIGTGTQTTANSYQVSVNVNASDFGDIKSIQDFIKMLQSAPTTQLVNAAGTVTS